MKAIAQVVPAGHRLRLAVSPDYWPWLWPSPVPVTLAVHTGGSEVRLPVRRPAPGDGDDPFSAPVNAPPLDLEVVEPGSGGMTIEHDGRKVTVTHDWDLGGRVRFPDGIASADYNRATYAIDASDPLSARVAVECLSGYGRGDWWTEVRIDSTMTADGENFAVACTLEALENGAPVAEKRWSATLPRDGV
jgi:hypothetical protein